MSGFWLDKTKFMTCAHFLETIRSTNGYQTETFLKASNPERPRAFASNKKRAVGLNAGSPESWPVYLLRLSKSSDIAFFELTQAVTKWGNHPPYSVQLHELSSSFAIPTYGNALAMPFKEPDLAHVPLFAAYYPGHNMSATVTFVPSKKSSQNKPTWGIPGVYGVRKVKILLLDYATTFTPNTRNVAFGQVETDHRGAPKHGKQGNSRFVQTRECSIVGSYGCSGGMVCNLYREANSWQSAVVGLYHGESWNNRRYNEFVAFTPDFVEAIRTGAFWATG
ncbi:uncharacterized protein A1O9_05047 [Exophiala aquamarina CBS 119918]|uniref:Uncharacterized protein n=1 Tax=Exophiala aquamarina CBS 119918 TaxID=1182545 RepID=A0A072PKB5_9EURO|nr:uncharacterized protein A1O9_05047 [Exophiala aquamarina CBS 119918]KEF60197.1 hypothetical protein A1O9_05047 [Exophiala aquamarina CBS 119918]